MRVLVMTDYFLPGNMAGGAPRTLSRLVPIEARTHELSVVTRDRDAGVPQRYTDLERQQGAAAAGVPVQYVDTRSLGGLGRLIRSCLDRRVDVVYLNSLWSPVFALLPLVVFFVAGARGRTVLIAPRGELHPGALAVKSRKKRVVRMVLRRALRVRWVAWHASSDLEAADIRRWMKADVPVVVSVDQAEPPDPQPSAGSGSTEALRVVCITRIVPKKDVRRLLEVISRATVPLDVRLYGPLEDQAYWRSCEELIERLPEHVCFSYDGVLSPEGVSQAYREADLMLFPTRGENFGHVIAEALAVGCPVVTTPTTYWTDWLDAGAGFTFTDDTVAAAYLDGCARKLPAQRAAHRSETLAIYTDWYRDSVLAPSLFAELAGTRDGASKRGAQ